MYFIVFFFKQKTAYEMRISDWSSDVCSSDLASCELTAREKEDRRRHARVLSVRERRGSLLDPSIGGSGERPLKQRASSKIFPPLTVTARVDIVRARGHLGEASQASEPLPM